MQELRQKHALNTLLNIANLPRSVFYYHSRQSTKPDKNLDVKEHITKIYHEHKGRYGYRRICAELNNQGIVINHKKVQRLMKELGLKAKIRRQRHKPYSSYQGEAQDKIKDNALQRDFKADKPNQKWATDVTEFKVEVKSSDSNNGNDSNSNNKTVQKLYLSPIIDLFNGEIISYTICERPTYDLVQEMLDNALNRLDKDDKLIIHSDRGWQYQMNNYQQILKDNGIIQSMSRKGNCLDNAVIESFFGTLKQEIFYEQTKFTSLDELKKTIDEYIHYYNHDRIKMKLKGLSPVKYRNLVLGETT